MQGIVRTLCLIATLALATLAHAQQTWIVDAAKGPGWHFEDLPQAVATAAPGDRLLVRSGIYHGTTVDKGLTIEATDPVFASTILQSNLRIAGLPRGHRVLLKGLQFGYWRLYFPMLISASLVCWDNRGSIHLENCYHHGNASDAGLVAVHCDLVSAKDSVFRTGCTAPTSTTCIEYGQPGVQAVSSNLHFERCELSAFANGTRRLAGDFQLCFATFVNCRVLGASRGCRYESSCYCYQAIGTRWEAFQSSQSTFAFHGESSEVRGGSEAYCCYCTTPPLPLILATSYTEVIHDTAIVITSSGPVTRRANSVPYLDVRPASTGDAVEVRVTKAPPGFMWLALGAPARRIPAPEHGLWIETGSWLVLNAVPSAVLTRLEIPKGLPAHLVVGMQAAFVTPSWSGLSVPTFFTLP